MKKIITLLSILFITISCFSQNYKLIVNSANSNTSITKQEASDFFLKKKTKWSTGEKVAVVDMTPNSSTRIDFTKDVHGKSVGQVRAYWQQSVFAGKATPPKEVDSDAEVIEFVKSNPGAVGYVSSGASTAGVKVITVN